MAKENTQPQSAQMLQRQTPADKGGRGPWLMSQAQGLVSPLWLITHRTSHGTLFPPVKVLWRRSEEHEDPPRGPSQWR